MNAPSGAPERSSVRCVQLNSEGQISMHREHCAFATNSDRVLGAFKDKPFGPRFARSLSAPARAVLMEGVGARDV